jgi:hypothetical protein
MIGGQVMGRIVAEETTNERQITILPFTEFN